MQIKGRAEVASSLQPTAIRVAIFEVFFGRRRAGGRAVQLNFYLRSGFGAVERGLSLIEECSEFVIGSEQANWQATNFYS